MKLEIKHQESYSRGELLLRTIFGIFYMIIPFAFVMIFLAIWSAILTFIAWWAILFTGRYPKSFYEYQVKYIRWQIRWSARFSNLADGYPGFSLGAADPAVTFEAPYPERLSRGQLLLKSLFGYIYCLIPHYFMLIFASLWGSILGFLAWWIILFTGTYPASWHAYNTGLLRWSTRVGMYMSFLTDEYPPFSGKP